MAGLIDFLKTTLIRGALFLVPLILTHEVQMTDLSVAEAIDCLTQLGNGSHSLLGQLTRHIPSERS